MRLTSGSELQQLTKDRLETRSLSFLENQQSKEINDRPLTRAGFSGGVMPCPSRVHKAMTRSRRTRDAV